MYQIVFSCNGLHQTGDKWLPEPVIARILSLYWVIRSQCWACKSRRQSSLDCWLTETCAVSTPNMNHFCLWCSVVNCWQEQIHKFKTEYLLIWQKYLSTWSSIKYFSPQVQVSTKYYWISKGQVQVSTKYSLICIKYQVQVLYLTPTLIGCDYRVYMDYMDLTVHSPQKGCSI